MEMSSPVSSLTGSGLWLDPGLILAVCSRPAKTFFHIEARQVSHRSRSLSAMGIRFLAEGSWSFLEQILFGRLREHSCIEGAGDPAGECWLLVPSPRLIRHLQRELAASLGAVQGVRLMQFSELARRILISTRTGAGRTLDRLARDLLLHRVIEEALPGIEEIIGVDTLRTPAFEQAAIKTLLDLREAGIEADTVAALAARNSGPARARLEAVAHLHEAATREFDRLAIPDHDAALRQAAAVVAEGPHLSAEHLVAYGFYDLTGSQAALLDALAELLPTDCCVPCYRETDDYAGDLLTRWRNEAKERREEPDGTDRPVVVPLRELWDTLAQGRDRRTSAGRTLTVVSQPGRGREVDAALRLLAAAWRGGMRAEETAVAAFAPDRYRGTMHEEAVSAGFGDCDREPALLIGFLLLLHRGAAGELTLGELSGLLSTAARLFERPLCPLPDGRLARNRYPAGTLAEWAGRLRETATHSEESDPAQAVTLREAADLLDEVIPAGGCLVAQGDPVEGFNALVDLLLPRLTASRGEALLQVLDRVRTCSALGGPARAGDMLWILGWLQRAAMKEGRGGSDPEQVAVESVMDLRGCRMELVVALGLGEGTVPTRPGPDPLLLEDERAALTGANPWLLSTPSRRLLEEKLLFRLLLETGRQVVLIYPRLDEDGREKRMSPLVRELLRDPGESRTSAAEVERAAARDSRSLGTVALLPGEPLLGETDRDLAATGAVLGSGGIGRSGAESATVQLAALWGSQTFAAGWRAEICRWKGAPGPYSGCLDSADLRRSACEILGLDSGGPISASLLQEYATCPWRTFVTRILKLDEERAEPTGLLDPLELGIVLHAVLEAHVRECREADEWPPVPGSFRSSRAALGELATREVRRAYRHRGRVSPAFERAESRRVLNRIGPWLEWEAGREMAAAGGPDLSAPAAAGWETAALEEKFDHPLTVPGREMVLRGRWDRVDRDRSGRVRIIDYKTGGGRLPAAGEITGGRQLQMPLYLIAARDRFGEGEESAGGLAGGIFLQLDPKAAAGAPKVIPWPEETVLSHREVILGLVADIVDSIEGGLFLRLPHEQGTDSQSGLCRGCPTPTICRGWPDEESLRYLRHERLAALNRVRARSSLDSGEEA